MKKGVKYYLAHGIIGYGKLGITEGIPCHLIHNAFNNKPCISGDSRLRHELKSEYDNMIRFEIWRGIRKKHPQPYEYKNKRYYINKTFLIYLRKTYGKI